jgi:hypothetical protein
MIRARGAIRSSVTLQLDQSLLQNDPRRRVK